MAKFQTTAHGLTMEWTLIRKTHHVNAANPFVILGSVDGVCRMEHAISAATAKSRERIEQRVIARLEQIAQEAR